MTGSIALSRQIVGAGQNSQIQREFAVGFGATVGRGLLCKIPYIAYMVDVHERCIEFLAHHSSDLSLRAPAESEPSTPSAV
jgi:hypothetical protein